MPTRKSRIALTIDHSVKNTYYKTAELMGIPAATFIANLLNEAEPSIKAMQKPLLSAKNDQLKAITEMDDLMSGISTEVKEHQLEMKEFTDKIPK
jgi:antitoxin component of RelBE/YafQ-DinJ toxin-antitoxin module